MQIVSAVRKIGWNVDMLGQAASYDEAVAEVPGGVTEGFYSMTPVLFVAASDSSPAVTKFAETYKKQFGKEPNFAAQLGYTARAARRAGAEECRQGPDGRQLRRRAWRASRTGTTSSARRR